MGYTILLPYFKSRSFLQNLKKINIMIIDLFTKGVKIVVTKASLLKPTISRNMI